VEKHIGSVAFVFHEFVSNQVHVDVLVIEPTEERPFWTFVTSGMSAKPMPIPEEAREVTPSFCEVMLVLPADWQFSGVGKILGSSEGDYPIAMLRYAAHFPHNYATWLGAGHTIRNGDPPEPLSSQTKMCAFALTPILTAHADFNRLTVDSGETIGFYGVIPLHEDELALKLERGMGALYDLFDRHRISEIFDPSRSSVVPAPKSKGFLNWFKR